MKKARILHPGFFMKDIPSAALVFPTDMNKDGKDEIFICSRRVSRNITITTRHH